MKSHDNMKTRKLTREFIAASVIGLSAVSAQAGTYAISISEFSSHYYNHEPMFNSTTIEDSFALTGSANAITQSGQSLVFNLAPLNQGTFSYDYVPTASQNRLIFEIASAGYQGANNATMPAPTVVFHDLEGVAPTMNFSWAGYSTGENSWTFNTTFDITGDFSFSSASIEWADTSSKPFYNGEKSLSESYARMTAQQNYYSSSSPDAPVLSFTSIPEPATSAIGLLLGLLGFATNRRRR